MARLGYCILELILWKNLITLTKKKQKNTKQKQIEHLITLQKKKYLGWEAI